MNLNFWLEYNQIQQKPKEKTREIESHIKMQFHQRFLLENRFHEFFADFLFQIYLTLTSLYAKIMDLLNQVDVFLHLLSSFLDQYLDS